MVVAGHRIQWWWVRRTAVALLWALGTPLIVLILLGCGLGALAGLAAAAGYDIQHVPILGDNTFAYLICACAMAVPVLLFLGLLGRLPGTRPPTSGAIGPGGGTARRTIGVWLRRSAVSLLWAGAAFVGVAYAAGWTSGFAYMVQKATSAPAKDLMNNARPLLFIAPHLAAVVALTLGLAGLLPGTRSRPRDEG